MPIGKKGESVPGLTVRRMRAGDLDETRKEMRKLCGTILAAGMAALLAHGNPVFDGWYADPQIRIYGDTYWVFPMTSTRFDEQTSFDAFSSRDALP